MVAPHCHVLVAAAATVSPSASSLSTFFSLLLNATLSSLSKLEKAAPQPLSSGICNSAGAKSTAMTVAWCQFSVSSENVTPGLLVYIQVRCSPA